MRLTTLLFAVPAAVPLVALACGGGSIPLDSGEYAWDQPEDPSDNPTTEALPTDPTGYQSTGPDQANNPYGTVGSGGGGGGTTGGGTGGGGGACLPCSGTLTCASDDKPTDTSVVTLSPAANNACEIVDADKGSLMTLNCDGSATFTVTSSTSGSEAGTKTSTSDVTVPNAWMRSGSGFHLCVVSDNGKQSCYTCT